LIELYAITDHPGPELPDPGALRVVARGSLAGVYGDASEDQAITPDGLWRHEQIVEELMEDRTVLPVRYGTRFADERAAGRVLEERGEQFSAALDRVRGAVELAVRVIGGEEQLAPAVPPSAEPVATVPRRAGTEYLRARLRERTSESEAVQLVHEPLSALAREHVLRPVVLPDERMRAAYLVDATAVQAFSAAVQRLQDAHPSLLITCTGPWPAYSFTQS
jgi:hypothetical protein